MDYHFSDVLLICIPLLQWLLETFYHLIPHKTFEIKEGTTIPFYRSGYQGPWVSSQLTQSPMVADS